MHLRATLAALLLALLPAILGASAPAPTKRPLYTIYSGFAKGTYVQMANDIKKTCTNLEIQVELTDGSLDNINSLLTPPVNQTGHRFAFVQSDALSATYAREPRTKPLVKPVLNMYNEEISVIVSKTSGIRTLRDLEGKRVSVGVVGSGTWFSAHTLSAQLGITWIPIEKTPADSILSLLVNDIDAMIVVAGHPVDVFKELSRSVAERIQFIDLSQPELNRTWQTAKLPANTYLWQDSAVELRATRSMLVVAGDVPPNATDELMDCLRKNRLALRQYGHHKWYDVVIQDTPPKK